MTKTQIQPWYASHRHELAEILKRYDALYGQGHLEGMEDPSLAHLLTLDAAFRFPLRPYQREAISILNELFGIVQDDKAMKGRGKRRELMQELFEDVNRKKVPFLGFEMATGSGKTLVMGASIALLAERFGVRNFLILVGGPASSNIYQKTIANFTPGHPTCIWEGDGGFAYNLVTGENYRDAQPGLSFVDKADVNVFVFNIQKFTETSGQTGEKTRRTQKPWESAPWKDRYGNTVSLHEYLQEERLVIVTDEAHHTQGKASQDIIKSFEPEAVLEFTATADELGGGDRRAQDIVYKYDIRQFLDEGYGKLIRALPLDASIQDGGTRDELDDYEKRKLISALLVHLVKREALACDPASRITKPVCLVKVKDRIEAADRVLKYLRQDLVIDRANLSWVVEKTLGQDLEVLDRFADLWDRSFGKSLDRLAAELGALGREAIGVYGDPDKETRKAFETICTNKVELVVNIKMLDEGIDIPNIYTMVVVKDNETDLVTSIKQIIGRGVRLNKDVRVYDDSSDPWLRQAELLHVVCDRGAAFESVIAAIQSVFGLTDRHFVVERPGKANAINHAKRHLLEGRVWPELKADLVVREGVKLLELLSQTDDIVSDYLDGNCFYRGELGDDPVLKFKPQAFFVEVDIFADPEEYRKQLSELGASLDKLDLGDGDWKDIYIHCLRLQTTIPDIGPVREIFKTWRAAFSEAGIRFFWIDEADKAQAKKHFAKTFGYFVASYVEKHYYRLDIGSLGEDGQRQLSACFRDEDIFLPHDAAAMWKSAGLDSVAGDMIKRQVPFRGYANNAYEYVAYDSLPEKHTGDLLDARLNAYVPIPDARPVWIRNQRQLSLGYGNRRYYPDFIVCQNDKMFILETKGDPWSDQRKNQLLAAVEKVTGGRIKAVLAFTDWIDRFGQQAETLEDFIYAADSDATRRLQLHDLEFAPPAEQKSKSYLPVYSPEKAHKKWVKRREGVRIDGWAKIEAISGKPYPESCFAIANRSRHLEHLGPWLAIDAARVEPADNESVLLHFGDFDDDYKRGFSVRKVRVGHEKTGGMFDRVVWELDPLPGGATIRLRPEREKFDAIGIVLEHGARY